jgi:hypothetical protein
MVSIPAAFVAVFMEAGSMAVVGTVVVVVVVVVDTVELKAAPSSTISTRPERRITCSASAICWAFAPRIKDLKDRKLYTVEEPGTWPLLAPLIGDTVETAAILGQWTELMRLKASIETGAVVPSVILRKLAAAGAGNVLSRELRALGRIDRPRFTLQWLSDPALRQRGHAGLNKGEASNALRRGVFFHRKFATAPSRTKVSARRA